MCRRGGSGRRTCGAGDILNLGQERPRCRAPGLRGRLPCEEIRRPRCLPARMELLTVTGEAALSRHFVLGSADIFSHTQLKNCVQAVPLCPFREEAGPHSQIPNRRQTRGSGRRPALYCTGSRLTDFAHVQVYPMLSETSQILLTIKIGCHQINFCKYFQMRGSETKKMRMP